MFQRDKAWQVYPYPCIGQFRFLQLNLCQLPSYGAMVQRLKDGARYLEIGCCLGQDIRKLVADGVPSGQLYGIELEKEFIDLGYDFFKDRDSLEAHLFQADILDRSSSDGLDALSGTMEFVHLGMVLHIFEWDQQREILERCITLLKAQPGVMILGQAVGNVEGGGLSTAGPAGASSTGKVGFKHNVTTFQKLWKEIEERTGARWECRASIDGGLGVDSGARKWDTASARRLVFEVERL